MKKISLLILVLSTALFVARPSVAVTPLGGNARNIVKEGRLDGLSPTAIKKEVRQEVKERNESLFDRVKNLVKTRLRFDARITGTMAAKGDNSMTVAGDDGKTYQVNIITGTGLVRR